MKKYSNDLSKPPMRISPAKRQPPHEGSNFFQTTPKRLRSPQSLKVYPREGTSSVDRINFKGSESVNSTGTDFVFHTSPVRPKFSNIINVGGDGSLSRIRTRFSNGVKSPQKEKEIHSAYPDKVQKNLFVQLQQQESLHNSVSDFNDTTRINTTINSMKIRPQDDKKTIKKPKSLAKKKTVKFKLNEEKNLKSELSEIRALLMNLTERQDQLEQRLFSREESYSPKDS